MKRRSVVISLFVSHVVVGVVAVFSTLWICCSSESCGFETKDKIYNIMVMPTGYPSTDRQECIEKATSSLRTPENWTFKEVDDFYVKWHPDCHYHTAYIFEFVAHDTSEDYSPRIALR